MCFRCFQTKKCLLENLKLGSPSALTAHQVNTHTRPWSLTAMCSHTHTHLHSSIFILKTIQTTYLSCSIAFSAPLAEPPLNSHCISTMSVYTCEILPTKTACAQSVPLDTHARTPAHARPHTMALTMLILLHFSCDRCSVYFCRTTALKKTKKRRKKKTLVHVGAAPCVWRQHTLAAKRALQNL